MPHPVPFGLEPPPSLLKITTMQNSILHNSIYRSCFKALKLVLWGLYKSL